MGMNYLDRLTIEKKKKKKGWPVNVIEIEFL